MSIEDLQQSLFARDEFCEDFTPPDTQISSYWIRRRDLECLRFLERVSKEFEARQLHRQRRIRGDKTHADRQCGLRRSIVAIEEAFDLHLRGAQFPRCILAE